MGKNGKRRPLRPKIKVIEPAATEAEAAAIVAALQQFWSETSSGQREDERLPAWQRQMLLEGTGRAGIDPWGESLN